MTYRKTWFSCVVWIMYTILCIALLMYAGNVWTYYLAGVPYTERFPDSIISPLAGLSDGALVLIGLLIIPFTIGAYWIICGVSGWVRKKCVWRKSVITGFECISVLLMMAAGIILRINCAQYDISMVENGTLSAYGQLYGVQFYDAAVLTVENSTQWAYGSGLGGLYVFCLSIVLSFLGNKIASAIIMQVFLQIIGMVLVYAVTRMAAGRIPACVALLYLACSDCCMEMLICIGPEWLFFDLCLLGMLFAVSFVKSYCANRLRRPVAVIGSIILGGVIGLLVYLHPVAITLLIILAAVAVGRKRQQEDQPMYHSGMISALIIIVTILVGLLSWVGVTAAVYYEEGTGIYGIIERCIGDFDLLLYDFDLIPAYPYVLDIYLMGVLVIPATFLVFEFLRKDKEQNYTLWMLICILAAPTPMFVLGQAAGEEFFGIFSLYVWAVLAGLGLQNCIFGGRAKVMQAVIEQINSTAELEASEQPNGQEMAGEPEQTDKQEITVASEQTDGQEVIVEPEQSAYDGQETFRRTDEAEIIEEPEKPRFFENPLPLPKKHVKKEMDYQYQVDEKDMKYDIEVPENDDFDIQ